MRPIVLLPALLLLGVPVLRGAGVHDVERPAVHRDGGTTTVESDDALLSALGCGGCHGGLPAPGAARAAAPALGPDAAPLSPDFVFEWLADPVPRRPEIAPSRMPDFGLSEGERVALALFLGRGQPGPTLSAAAGRHPDRDASTGRSLFGVLGCGNCHTHPDAPEPGVVAPPLGNAGERLRPGWVRRWLAAPGAVRPAHLGGGRMPDFRLAEDELDAVTRALTGDDGRGRDSTPDGRGRAGIRGGAAPGPAAPVPEVGAARAERLLDTRYACRGCHVVAGRGGGLGPPLDGVVERLRSDAVVRMIRDPQGLLPGSAMPPQPMPANEAAILADYLLGLPGPWRGPDPQGPGRRPVATGGSAVGTHRPEAAAGSGTGAALYATWCAACHGPGGAGDGWNAPALPAAPTAHADAAVLAPRPDDVLFDGIHGGGWVLGRSPAMPAFGEFLTPDEIDALVAHLRTLCDCRGPAWSRDGGGA